MKVLSFNTGTNFKAKRYSCNVGYALVGACATYQLLFKLNNTSNFNILAIYVAIKRADESYMALALTFAITGIAVYLATNNPFSLLSLSN